MKVIKKTIKNVKVYDKSELEDIKEFFETITPESERNAVRYSTPVVEFEADCIDHFNETLDDDVRENKLPIFI